MDSHKCTACGEIGPKMDGLWRGRIPNGPWEHACGSFAQSGHFPAEPLDTEPRPPACRCHLEIGDSPCPVHGEDEEAPRG